VALRIIPSVPFCLTCKSDDSKTTLDSDISETTPKSDDKIVRIEEAERVSRDRGLNPAVVIDRGYTLAYLLVSVLMTFLQTVLGHLMILTNWNGLI